MSCKVFVYGTLKRGLVNEPLLADEKYLGRSVTQDEDFKLLEVTEYRYPFPALVKSAQNGYRVFGELYEARDSCMAYLDQLEGVEMGLYKRSYFNVLLENGRVEENVVGYTYLRETNKCTHVGACWPLTEMSRWLFANKQLVTSKEKVEQDGVALWNKRTSEWATDAFESSDLLKESCAGKRSKFGATQPQEFWSSKWFEERKRKLSVERSHLYCINPYLPEVNRLSPSFDDRKTLAEWAADNLTFFGGQRGSMEEWKRVLDEAVPIIEET